VKTVLDSLNAALHRSMESDPCVYMIGEDILDPYGGAFKATKGLSSKFPERVWTAPISEAGMIGIATGMALRGLRPVVEIMFGDFLTLAADQIINHAAKFRWMYNDQVRVPLVIRTPMGGRRGYGPTHSQTLEKLFMGIPGLTILAPSPFAWNLVDPGSILENAIRQSEDPVLFVENKLLYLLPVLTQEDMPDFELSYTSSEKSEHGYKLNESGFFKLKVKDAPQSSLTFACYGYMAELARQAIFKLAYEYEIFAEMIAPVQLSPFKLDSLFDSVRQTRKLLVVEEGSLSMGWGAEVLARTLEMHGSNRIAARRLAARETPIPASAPLEKKVLPGLEDIITSAVDMVSSPGALLKDW
jgi:acetoin:2,6-dichlorophenolindophenol oxidoreductase subunit beta